MKNIGDSDALFVTKCLDTNSIVHEDHTRLEKPSRSKPTDIAVWNTDAKQFDSSRHAISILARDGSTVESFSSRLTTTICHHSACRSDRLVVLGCTARPRAARELPERCSRAATRVLIAIRQEISTRAPFDWSEQQRRHANLQLPADAAFPTRRQEPAEFRQAGALSVSEIDSGDSHRQHQHDRRPHHRRRRFLYL